MSGRGNEIIKKEEKNNRGVFTEAQVKRQLGRQSGPRGHGARCFISFIISTVLLAVYCWFHIFPPL